MNYEPSWSSHIPLLVKVMNVSEGPVLEMGIGPFSTPLLHWLCFDQNRTLTSYDNSKEYLEANKTFETSFHQIKYLDNWDDADIENTHWGVVFIDHAPPERRPIDVARVANCADYIVIHDSQRHLDQYFHYKSIYGLFKYKYVYRKVKPHTTVLSNFKDLNIFNDT